MCTDSVKFLFSDKFTMSVANNLELLSDPGFDRRSVATGTRRPRSHHSHDHHNSGSGSDREMDDDGRGSHHPIYLFIYLAGILVDNIESGWATTIRKVFTHVNVYIILHHIC